MLANREKKSQFVTPKTQNFSWNTEITLGIFGRESPDDAGGGVAPPCGCRCLTLLVLRVLNLSVV